MSEVNPPVKLNPHPKFRRFQRSLGKTSGATPEIPAPGLNAVPGCDFTSPIALRRVQIADLVFDLGIWLEGEKPMRKAHRHEKLAAIVGTEVSGHPPPVGGRAVADIDGDVPYPAPNAPDQLVLRPWRGLEMEPAQDKGAA